MNSNKILKQIEELLLDLRFDVESERILVNKIDDVLDLVKKLKKSNSQQSSDPYAKFRKFQGLV